MCTLEMVARDGVGKVPFCKPAVMQRSRGNATVVISSDRVCSGQSITTGL
jgi:hypothetical protein